MIVGSFMTIAFVTAMYAVASAERVAEIWARLQQLATVLPLHVVCAAVDAAKVPAGCTAHVVEFADLETFKVVSKTTGLPRVRSESKDTKDFMILMNAKTEFIKRVRDKGVHADHYVWIDAGIGKIFRDPVTSYNRLATILAGGAALPADRAVIPGCWARNERDGARNGRDDGDDDSSRAAFDALLTRVSWRFCGGVFVIPRGLVDLFYYHALAACEEIRVRAGLAIWEVNLWDYLEQGCRVPIQWRKADHNELLFEALGHF
jgi:hypothetical protein